MQRSSTADRVLIIDDDVMSREVFTFLLEDACFAIDSVASGEAALEHLRVTDSAPTVVLADVQLPGISGAALAAALRAACPAGTPLIAMSGSDPEPEAIAAFDTFLLKPFAPAALTAAIALCRHSEAKSPSHEGVSRSHKGGRPEKTAEVSQGASNPGMSAQTYMAQPGPPLPLSAPSSALDERIYKQLGNSMNRKQLREMYGLCLDDVRKRIRSMRGLAAREDAEQFVREAHAIKGGCGMLGASELYKMAATLEKAGLGAAGLEGSKGVNPLDELAAACDRLERILGTRT